MFRLSLDARVALSADRKPPKAVEPPGEPQRREPIDIGKAREKTQKAQNAEAWQMFDQQRTA